MLEKFLNAVWRLQNPTEGEFLFVSQKDWDSGEWRDYPQRSGHIDLPASRSDLYFAPCVFTESRRLARHARAGRWLYADLDEIHPESLGDLEPSVAWCTSPGRYQGLWLLDRSVSPRALQDLNQRLTYYTGADKGGWSLTKVLRIPGSISTKYGGNHEVGLLWSKRREFPYEELRGRLPPPGELPIRERPEIRSLPAYDDVWRSRRRRLSARARTLLTTNTVLESDDRSARLWELENELVKSNLPLEEIFVLVRESPWNKYRGQRREVDMLWKEIEKVSAFRADPQTSTKVEVERKAAKAERAKRRTSRLKIITYRDMMTKASPKSNWLVEDIWSQGAHGILAGEAKSFKSLLTIDLAVSVASGTPFLGRFHVPRVGRVCIIQEENTEGDVTDRAMRISRSRNVGPNTECNGSDPGRAEIFFGDDLPIHFLHNRGFSLLDDSDLEWLEKYAKKHHPVLIILDPLYLMTSGASEDKSNEMGPILNRLLRIKQKYDCGIMIVHHYRKQKEGDSRLRRAERMSGTNVFHRWLASGVYVERLSEHEPRIRLSSEHRGHASSPAYEVTFDLGHDDDLHYSVDVDTYVEKKSHPEKVDAIENAVTSVVGQPSLGELLPPVVEPTEVVAIMRTLREAGHTFTSKQVTRALLRTGYAVLADGSEYTHSGGTSRRLVAYPR